MIRQRDTLLHDTPMRPSTLPVGSTLHVLPFHETAKLAYDDSDPSKSPPTAMHLAAPVQDTALRL